MTDLAIFDLDDTLLDGDSDYAWGQYVIAQGWVDRPAYEQKNRYFMDQYAAGNLDIHEYIAFICQPLLDKSLAVLQQVRTQYINDTVKPMLTKGAQDLIQRHREQEHYCLIITATNSLITEPLPRVLGVDHLLGTDLEVIDGHVTGRIQGTPCFQKGKVARLQQWLAEQSITFEQTYFYSDSHNDLPLLETVDYPHAVNPNDTLRQVAQDRHWPILNLRHNA